MGITLILFLFLIIEAVNSFDITVTGNYQNNEIGKKGAATLTTNFLDEQDLFDKSDIETESVFSTEILDTNQKNYTIKCRLWKAENINLIMFCNFDENKPEGEYSISFNNKVINYKDYEININTDTDIKIKKIDRNITNLYSDKQVINVEDGKDSYNLKFKINSYNNEPLYFMKELIYTYLDKCETVNNELICNISKSKLEEIMSTNEEKFWINYIDNDYNFNKLSTILEIKVNYNNTKKEDIYVNITKLLDNSTEHDTLIAYETNVTNISKVFTSTESFSMKFGGEERNCGFRKYEENPLLMVCWGPKENSHLDEIVEEKVLNKINIKYNFRIQPVNNTEMIDSDKTSSGSFINVVFPEVLNFTSQESITIVYYIEDAKALDGITFNEGSPALECENIGKSIKRCTVNSTHFIKNKSRYYYFTLHKNHLNGTSPSYEVSPIKVIFPPSYRTLIIVLCIIGGIVFILVFCFLVMHLKSKRNNFKFNPNDVKNIPLIEQN